MVHLRKIEARGFKSMGTTLISVPVEKGFVAITGPNGSGKSNLLDAILFALGENSAKTLRVSSLSGLIYDGSVEQQKPSSARVSLQFDNSDRRIPMDSDSLTITRELKQTGESLYSLNGKHIQRNNLGDLLENALIASRGLNVVLQGMITRISELVPDEKRKLIESMVGIAQFDEKKQEAMKQLGEADTKLEVAMAKIGEIRERVQALEQQRNDELRLRQLQKEIKWIDASSTSSKLLSVRKTLTMKRQSYGDLSTKLQQYQTTLLELTRTLEEFESQRSALMKSAMQSGTTQIEAALGRVANELNALKRERAEASKYLDDARQILPRMLQMKDENLKKISDAEEKINSSQLRIAEAGSRKQEILKLQGELNIERNSFDSEFTAAQNAIVELRKEKTASDTELQTTKDRLNKLETTRKLAEEKLASAKDKIRFLNENLGKAQENIGELEKVLSGERRELCQIEQSRFHLEKLRKSIELQLSLAASIVEKTQGVVTRYDSDILAMESVAAEEIAISKLEGLGDANAIKGYIGPLRTRISYDLKYSQAVAALGKEWLNSVIVSDVNALTQTMVAAKKLHISKLTTIPLSEVAAVERSSFPRSIEGMIVPVAELVRCEKRFRSLVNFVFGDAIIVDSPRNAFLAARKGFRAVTLDGDAFEPEVLAFQTGYSRKYAKLSNLLGKQ